MDYPLLAFVGGGHMASAIVGGVVAAGHPPGRIVVAGRGVDNLRRLESVYGVNTVVGADNLPAADAVVLAVRPGDAKMVCGLIKINAPLISVVAGLTLAQMQQCAPKMDSYIRAMPNTPSQVGMGMTALFASGVDDKTRKMTDGIFASVGKTLWLQNEDMMAAATAISGSGPGYVFYFAEALMDTAKEMGFDDDESHLLVLQTIAGAAQLAIQSKENPTTLRQNIAVPGGTTEQAIKKMQTLNLSQIIKDAAKACENRARELSN